MRKYAYLSFILALVFILLFAGLKIGTAHSPGYKFPYSSNPLITNLTAPQVFLPIVMRQEATGNNLYQIAFVSHRLFIRGVFLMNEDGTEQHVISDSTSFDLFPQWSPDGEQIAFQSTRTGYFDIYIMNSDGSGLTQITNNPDEDVTPVWSPDGEKIAYVSGPSTGPFGLFVVNRDGSNPHKVADDVAYVAYISWSPDSSRIVFQRPGFVFIVNADGTNYRELSEGTSPNWSPVSERIAFRMITDENDPGDIYSINSDGSGLLNLTNSPEYYDDFPLWSPDGTHIAYWIAYGEDIWMMNADGTNQRNLTNDPDSKDRNFTWSPDGIRLAFEKMYGPDEDIDIFSMNINGSNLRNLTNTEYYDETPDWSPVPISLDR